MRWGPIAVAGVVIAAVLVALGSASGVIVDWAWFSTIGYVSVFWTAFAMKAVIFAVMFSASALLLWVNGALALRFTSQRRTQLPRSLDPIFMTAQPLPAAASQLLRPAGPVLPWGLIIFGVALLTGLFVAIAEIGKWDLILRFIYQVPYGRTDPVFNRDIGFYLFSLPVYIALKNWMMLILFLSAVMAGAIYVADGQINLDRRPWRISSAVVAHGSVLLGCYFAVKAWSYALDRYLLLYNDNGVVVGAGYADIHVGLPGLWVLIFLAAAAALLAWANARRQKYGLVIIATALVFGGSFVFAGLVPALYERLYVKPSELQLETPYITRSIDLTREAYNLRQITAKPFPAEQGLTFAVAAAQPRDDRQHPAVGLAAVDGHLRAAAGNPYLLQVPRCRHRSLSPRRHVSASDALRPRAWCRLCLPANAQTWVNLHLLFTHGNGAVMSPVTQKSAEGLPIFYLKDIPPVASGGPPITEPRLYFGEGTDEYVIVRGSTPEFDYPKGKDNVYTTYDGADGIPIGGDGAADPICLVFRRSEYSAQPIHHSREQDLDSPQYSGARAVRSRRSCSSIMTHTSWSAQGGSSGCRMPTPPATGFPMPSRSRMETSITSETRSRSSSTPITEREFYVADPADPIIATYQRIFPALFQAARRDAGGFASSTSATPRICF